MPLFLLLILVMTAIGCDADRREIPPIAKEPGYVNLINESYFRPFDIDSVEDGVVGQISEDFDGDGEKEDLIVYESSAIDERGEPMRDDGQVWFAYVKEKSGEKTYLFADWVQLGRLDVMQGPVDSLGRRPLLFWKMQGSGMQMYKTWYIGPDSTQAVELLSHEYDLVVPMKPWKR